MVLPELPTCSAGTVHVVAMLAALRRVSTRWPPRGGALANEACAAAGRQNFVCHRRLCSSSAAAARDPQTLSSTDDFLDTELASESEGPLDGAGSPSVLRDWMRPMGDTARKWVKVNERGHAYSVGRRKTAVARVWVWEAEGEDIPTIVINKKNISQMFGGHWDCRRAVLSPFFETNTTGRFAVAALVKGGGLKGVAPLPVSPVSPALHSPLAGARAWRYSSLARHQASSARPLTFRAYPLNAP